MKKKLILAKEADFDFIENLPKNRISICLYLMILVNKVQPPNSL